MNENTDKCETLSDLSKQKFRFFVDADEIHDVVIVRPAEKPGFVIGPLATVPMGSTEISDEGEEVLELTGEDGLLLYCITALPFFAELVCWINSELDEIADSPIPPQFVSGLRERAKWLQELIDNRDATVGQGTHGFEKFSTMKEKK